MRSTAAADPFASVQQATRRHLAQHGCGAYTFEDGPALRKLAARVQPLRVLELGTALGYSACCMAHGSAQALVDTVERDPSHVALAREQIALHGMSARITVHQGEFDQVLPKLAPGYDMVFFDGFAPPIEIIEAIGRLLAVGGILVCANLLLAHRDEARQLAIALDDTRMWTPLDSLEGGRTKVLKKIAL